MPISGLLYGRRNFIYMGIGLSIEHSRSGFDERRSLPDPNKWETERIYSFTRITLAPILDGDRFCGGSYRYIQKIARMWSQRLKRLKIIRLHDHTSGYHTGHN